MSAYAAAVLSRAAMLSQQPETRAVYCTDEGCDLWVFGSSTVWVALFYGLGRMGGKTVRTSWESHERVIKICFNM